MQMFFMTYSKSTVMIDWLRRWLTGWPLIDRLAFWSAGL